MSPPTEKPSPQEPSENEPLRQALKRIEHVHDKVKQAALDLSSVNAVLQKEVAGGVPFPTVDRALEKNEEIENSIQEAAEEILAVNEALVEGIDQQLHLEERLSKSGAKLSGSRAAARRSRHNALHDPVTGLPNLTLYNDRLINSLAQAQRHDRRLAVMFVDLDQFKSVNDTYGHDVGDQILFMVAQRLQSAMRDGDTVSRRGGDEFLILILEPADRTNTNVLAARIAATVAEPYHVERLTLALEASIGIAVYPEDGLTASDLLKKADFEMYAAKKRK